jgi:hypothetical protein
LLRILSALSWRSVDFCRMLRSDSLSPSPRSDGAFLSVVPDFFSDIIHFPGFVIYYKLAVVIRFLFTASPCSCQYPHSCQNLRYVDIPVPVPVPVNWSKGMRSPAQGWSVERRPASPRVSAETGGDRAGNNEQTLHEHFQPDPD